MKKCLMQGVFSATLIFLSSPAYSIDCSKIYAQGSATGAVVGLAIGFLADVQRAPLVLLGLLIGSSASDSSCEKLKAAKFEKDNILTITKMISDERAEISARNKVLMSEIDEYKRSIQARRGQISSRVAYLRNRASEEVVLLDAKVKESRLALDATSSVPEIKEEIENLLRDAYRSKEQIAAFLGQLDAMRT